MVALVPTVVPMMRRESGKTMIIRIRNGIERSRLIRTFSTLISQRGSGSTPSLSPATSSTPSGRPITMAKAVERSVT